jgi:L-serine dehydratase
MIFNRRRSKDCETKNTKLTERNIMQNERGINRRHFLQLATLAGAGAVLRPFPVYARQVLGKVPSEQTAGLAQSQINTITISIFDLLKIGPGPSSSHTIGPMKAANNFIETIRTLDKEKVVHAQKIEVRLFGSLSATGKAHGTDRAVLAGLLGQKPETCSAEFLDGLLKDPNKVYSIPINSAVIKITEKDIVFDKVINDYPFRNTLIMRLLGNNEVLFEREYYSVGGGFIEWKGWEKPEVGKPIYPYGNMTQLKALMRKNNVNLTEVMMANEKAITGIDEVEINRRIDQLLEAMEDSVERGLNTEGVLPGPIGLYRHAPVFKSRSHNPVYVEDELFLDLITHAFAAAEENAAGHRIVTAPTAGSAGVLPSVAYVMKHKHKLSNQSMRDGFLAAACIGFIAKYGASIAGAEVGCQGEIGVASSMAAAMLAHAHGYSIQIIENAAETAMEHHLGLTCDPVAGYVQIPCIERCTMGAVKAYNAFLIASMEIPSHHLASFDVVIRTMAETGKEMSTKYKETSEGGLALNMVTC